MKKYNDYFLVMMLIIPIYFHQNSKTNLPLNHHTIQSTAPTTSVQPTTILIHNSPLSLWHPAAEYPPLKSIWRSGYLLADAKN